MFGYKYNQSCSGKIVWEKIYWWKSRTFIFKPYSTRTKISSIDKTKYKLGIPARSKIVPVYIARDDQKNIVSYILPFYGQGLWSTLYGLLAVKADGNEIVGINFYEHGETPGLGGEISNPVWTAKWKGKQVYLNDKIVKVVKGPAPAGSKIEVDGISGATLTGVGVTNSLDYWLSENGYKPFLTKLIGE